jgi:membrane peptidoglycan carboxypeptidase
MKAFNLLLLLILFSSCKNEVKHNFYYENGSLIKDSSTIKLVAETIENQLKTNEAKNLKICTSLFDENTINFSKIVSKQKELMKKELIKLKPDKATLIRKCDQELLLSAGLIVFENGTGKIIELENSNPKIDLILNESVIGSSNKIYGFILAMSKNYQVNDDYVYYEKDQTTNSYSKHETKYLFKDLFCKTSSSVSIRFPYDDYSIQDWKQLNKMLKINLKLDNRNPDNILVESNFFDLVKTFYVLNNKGIFHKSDLVDKITTSDNKLIFSSKTITKKLIPNSTQQKMEQLLKYNMLEGTGRTVKKKLSLDNSHTVYYGFSTSNTQWILCSNKTYTIGVITKSNLIEKQNKNKLYVPTGAIFKLNYCLTILDETLKKLN